MSTQNNWCVAVKLPVFSGMGDQHSGVSYQCIKSGMEPNGHPHVSLYVAKGLSRKQRDQIVEMFNGLEVNIPNLPNRHLPLQKFASKFVVVNLDTIGQISAKIREVQKTVNELAIGITSKPHMYSPFRPHISIAQMQSADEKVPHITLNQEVVFGRSLCVVSWQE